MKPFHSNFRSAASINFNLLSATGCGFIAWAVWPSSIEWWGFGVIAVFLGGAAITFAVKAVRTLVELRAKKRAIAEFEAQGGGYRPAHFADEHDLEAWGMLDG